MSHRLLSLVAVVAACSPAASPPVDRPAEPMPRLAGVVLEPRMERHADELAALRAAVSAVDFPRAAVAARTILAEPRLARPSPQAGITLNDELPARFFALQDQLIEATREVEAAAEASDRDALEDAFGALTGTCRSCHEVYRGHP
jgi:hypothetical protein